MSGTKLIMRLLLLAAVWGVTPVHAVDLPQNFNFDGYLLNASNVPIVGPVAVKFQIYNPAATCLLFEETHAAVSPATDGSISLKIGSGTRASSLNDGGLNLKTIFQNDGLVRGAGTNCAGSYTPAASDYRKLRVTVAGTVLSPDYTMAPVPMASVAESLQGKVPADFVSSGGGTLTGPLILDADPSAALGAATKQYVDSEVASGVSGITLGGDVSGSLGAMSVSGIQGNPISPTAPSNGEVLKWNGTDWAPSPMGGLVLAAGSGTANTFTKFNAIGEISDSALTEDASYVNFTKKIDMGGNLIEDVGNPVNVQDAVTKSFMESYTEAVPSGTAAGQILQWNNVTTEWEAATPSGGDITDVVAGTGLTGGSTSGSATLAFDASYTDPMYVNVAGDTMTGNLGVGTIYAPPYLGTFVGNAASAAVGITRYGGAPSLKLMAANGSEAAPSNMFATSTLGGIVFAGHDGSTMGVGAQISAITAENFTPGAHGSSLTFATVPNASTVPTERVRIDSQGNVGIGTNTPTAKLDVSGNTNLNGPVTVGAGGSPIQIVKQYLALACGMGSIGIGSEATCTVAAAIANPGDSVICSPAGMPNYPLLHSCFVSAGGSVTIVARNLSTNGGAINAGIGSWNVTIIKH